MKSLFRFGTTLFLACLLCWQEFKLGSKVSDFTLTSLKGNPVRFSSLKGDVTVTVFISTGCPVSNDYNQRMNAIYREYSAKGVKFVFINSNENEPPLEVEEHAKKSGFDFVVYKDPGNVVADRFGAQVTPETFVVEKTGTIRYHGYIDDSRNPARIRVQGLRMALDRVLAGRPVEISETKAFGCTIKRTKRVS